MPWVSVIPSRKVFQPGPRPLGLQAAAPEKASPDTALAPGSVAEQGEGALEWGGGVLCAPTSIFYATNPASAGCPPH